jgi:hypothetical protein
MTKKWISLCLLLSGFLVGCATTVTNITSTTQPRNPNNQYLIEFQWSTTDQSVIPDSVQPYVVTGFDTFEMRPVMRMTNRWEAYVPVPPDKNVLVYHFKVDYETRGFGKPVKQSRNSEEYKLYIK